MSRGQEWERVKQMEKYLIKEILPCHLLEHLNDILTDIDRQYILAEQQNHGPICASRVLVDRVKRKGREAFSLFVVGLRNAGFPHAAQLLDPKCEVTGSIPRIPQEDMLLSIRGVAADLRIDVSLTHSNGGKFQEGAKSIAQSYCKTVGAETMKLRVHFSKFMDEEIKPYVNFIKTTRTEASPLILVFRLSEISAAEQLWNDFESERLKTMIENALTTFNQVGENFGKDDIRINVKIDKDNYEKVITTLSGQKTDGVAEMDKTLTPKRPPGFQPVFVDGEEKKELVLKPFQVELAGPAFEGRNTIICAPTGTGKTFVAMEVMMRHLVSEKMKIIVFIVNTVSLVQQQLDRLERYLPESVRITCLHGTTADIPLSDILENNNVVVLTAQVLVNALERGDVTISDFSLLVFDECHHTKKRHAYNEIMQWYLDDKFEAKSASLPQILGLSASLGVGTGNTGCGVKAEQHILEICANLDVHDLQVYENQLQCIDTKITPVSRKNMDIFSTAVNEVMEKIEEMLPSASDTVGKIPQPRGCQHYETWVVTLCKEDLGRDLMTCAEHLLEYNSSLMINEELRPDDALLYLQENLRSQESTDIELKLKDLYEQARQRILSEQERKKDEMNAGLGKLEELLLEKFSQESAEKSKGIIFVRTRYVAKGLENWIKKSSKLRNVVNPTRVIGCGQKNGNDGMTKTRQDQEIKKFRDGTCNVIIATSALLEGIDIPDCNFAINYGMPGNEITHVQARGRVRIEGQYEIIVGHDEKMLKERDLSKEKLMKQTIAKIGNMPKDEFRKKVSRIQKEGHDERLNMLATKSPQRKNQLTDGVNLHCKKCGEFACKANDVKVYREAHHLVPDKEILNRIDCQNFPGKNMHGGLCKIGEIFCKSCRQRWGNMAQNKYGKFPCLKSASFRVKNSDGSEGQVFKFWKDFPHKLQDFDSNFINLETES